MILNYLKLVRAKNLLIIVATQYLMRYAVIIPMLKSEGYMSQFSDLNFMFLVISTVCLAAAGYVINDYFDTKTDLLNRPDTVIVGKYINRRIAMNLHVILNIAGILLGLYISFQIHLWKLVYIYIIVAGLLWFYSTSYKRQFLVGNIIVATLTALVPLMTVLFEIPPLNVKYAEHLLSINKNFYYLFFWVLGFSTFAFITTLIREIIKDVEDYEGDTAFGRRTMPIVAGVKISKFTTISLTIISMALMIVIFFKYIFCSEPISSTCRYDYISLIYMALLLVIPNIYLIYKILKSENKSDWHKASVIAKLIMLAGIMYSMVIFYNFSF